MSDHSSPTVSIVIPARKSRSRPRRLWSGCLMAAEALQQRAMLATDVLSFHNDVASNGVNAAETQRTPANVKVGSFGKLYATAVDGQVYAQPLVQRAVTIVSGQNTIGGVAHNVSRLHAISVADGTDRAIEVSVKA